MTVLRYCEAVYEAFTALEVDAADWDAYWIDNARVSRGLGLALRGDLDSALDVVEPIAERWMLVV